MWFNKISFNRRDWILENYIHLKLSPVEFVIILKIDAANQSGIALSNEYLEKETGFDAKVVDEAIGTLVDKKYLTIKINRKQIEFDISQIFLVSTDSQASSLLEDFENEFGRPLSQHELETVNELVRRYEESLIIYGLRQASLRNKLSINYIERILINESGKIE